MRPLTTSCHASVWLLFTGGYLAFYFSIAVLPMPLLCYLPVEHDFTVAVRPTAIAIDFFSRVLSSLTVGATSAAIGSLLLRRLSEEMQGRWLVRIGIWSAALFLFSAGFYVHSLSGRHSPPAPLPSGYVPR